MQDNTYKFVPYGEEAKLRARELRRSQTITEKLLWERIRGRRFLGLKFLRQKPIHNFIIDFYCAGLRLGVEVDGEVHDAKRDGERDYLLESRYGVKILRYKNEEVLNKIELVLKDIENKISNLPSQTREG